MSRLFDVSEQGFYYENDVRALSLSEALSFSLIPDRFASGIRALIISAAIHAPVIAASTRNTPNLSRMQARPQKDRPSLQFLITTAAAVEIGLA